MNTADWTPPAGEMRPADWRRLARLTRTLESTLNTTGNHPERSTSDLPESTDRPPAANPARVDFREAA